MYIKFRELYTTTLDFLRVLWLDIYEKRVIGTASNLTYSSLLAFVPIMAVVFAIARGFGYSIYIEDWFRNTLSNQPEAAETIVGFVNSYLVNTQKGIFLGIGLIFMLFTVLMLISNIEGAFNDIWQVKHQRSIFRTFTDYIALLFSIPIVLVLSSGLSIWVAALNDTVKDVIVIGPMMTFFIDLSPYVIWSLAFIALYTFMPNTKVKLSSTWLPGCLAGVSMQILQLVYINSQIWISKYNAVYGSFAIIPFFLLWMQISWVICLVGAEISYSRQNAEDFFKKIPQDICFNSRLQQSSRIMEYVASLFREGKQAPTALEIKMHIGIPMRITNNLLYDLQRIHFIIEVVHDEKGDAAQYVPAESLSNITYDELEKRLSDLGTKL